jgi:hypothetical protein
MSEQPDEYQRDALNRIFKFQQRKASGDFTGQDIWINPEYVEECIENGWVKTSENGELALTSKGEYFIYLIPVNN